MKVQNIENQNFKANKFKLPLKKVSMSKKSLYGFIPKQIIEVDYYREYDNPNAKSIYDKAISAKTMKEKCALFAKMGNYTLVEKRTEIECPLGSLIDKIQGFFK